MSILFWTLYNFPLFILLYFTLLYLFFFSFLFFYFLFIFQHQPISVLRNYDNFTLDWPLSIFLFSHDCIATILWMYRRKKNYLQYFWLLLSVELHFVCLCPKKFFLSFCNFATLAKKSKKITIFFSVLPLCVPKLNNFFLQHKFLSFSFFYFFEYLFRKE